MSNVRYYDLGQNFEFEAPRLKKLYKSDGIDDRIIEEFGATVSAYRSLSYDDIAERLKSRYGSSNPPAYGTLGVINDTDFGMAIWGSKDYEILEGGEVVKKQGINVSAWVLKQFRSRGFGIAIIEYATKCAVELSRGKSQTSLTGTPVWTSIHKDNIASRKACIHAGFTEIGIQADMQDRRIYEVTGNNMFLN
jgi:GNAT superfamily N-acetyltransferase